jgi:hypothetical protein
MAIIFVSCGQMTQEEKDIGKKVCEIVRSFGHEPYFAESQTSLNGLHENILAKLHECSGFITIMHPRGEVRYAPRKQGHVRGSVWVEQEIAIAAFITHCLRRKIEVAAFIHRSIKREGIRDLLHLNPQLFTTSDEILVWLPAVIKSWHVASVDVELGVRYRDLKITGRRHDYILEVFAVNHGSGRLEKYQLDLWFPREFLEASAFDMRTPIERHTDTDVMFRTSEADFKPSAIFPTDQKNLLSLHYFVDTALFHSGRAMRAKFRAIFRYGDNRVIEREYAMGDFNKF